jgi:raffinose/stachyose/melibiose transport system substrate-binding protein
MTITGSWLAGELINDTDQEFGFFLMPPFEGKKALAIGGVGIPLRYPQDKHQSRPGRGVSELDDQPRAAELWAKAACSQPWRCRKARISIQITSLETPLRAWMPSTKANAVGHYIDWATPTFYDTLVAELQKLLGSISTPKILFRQSQKDNEAYLSK